MRARPRWTFWLIVALGVVIWLTCGAVAGTAYLVGCIVTALGGAYGADRAIAEGRLPL